MKIRSGLQNNSLHEYCEQLAEALNDAGITQEVFLRGLAVQNSMESIKNAFREMGNKRFGKNSTSKLTTIEMTAIYDEINLHTGEKFGLHIPWPCKEEQYLAKQRNRK